MLKGAGLLRTAQHDVAGGTFNGPLAFCQPAEGLEERRLRCLLGAVFQELREPLRSGVDSHLEAA